MTSYLTHEEELCLQESTLHRRSWFLIKGVSTSIFSVCRYYGGGRIQGEEYVYCPTTDELIRSDVLRWLRKYRHEKSVREKAAKRALRQAVERDLFEGAEA